MYANEKHCSGKRWCESYLATASKSASLANQNGDGNVCVKFLDAEKLSGPIKFVIAGTLASGCERIIILEV